MTNIQITKHSFPNRGFIAIFAIIVNSFSWYFPLYSFLQNLLESQVELSILLITLGIHYIGAIGSAFIGVALNKRFSSRNTFLYLWIIIGVISSAMLIMLDIKNLAYLLSVSLFLGISIGLGLPSCFAYFGDYTLEENRGRLGGITFLASGLGMLLIGLLISMSTFAVVAVIFTIWRVFGLILFYLFKPKHEDREILTEFTYKSILLDKHFILYLLPWIMFCFVNFFETSIVTSFVGADLALLIIIAEYGIGGFSAVIGGWLADSVGRKRIIIFGFIMLGVGYAILGLFSNILVAWYLYIILDGIAWGIFFLMFHLVIWADLARNRAKEKYYLIGVLPFIVSGYIPILLIPYANSIPISVAFSLASFFLFLAVLPLLYAPETLSEKEIEKKRLEKYLEHAKKVKKKHVKE